MQTEQAQPRVEEMVLKLLKETSSLNVEGGISKVFEGDDEDLRDGLLTKVTAHATKYDLSAAISGHNTATVKEALKQYPATEVQNALRNLKQQNTIMQLGRGRGRALVIFTEKKTFETNTPQEATPEPVMAAQREEEANDEPEPTLIEEARTALQEEAKKAGITLGEAPVATQNDVEDKTDEDTKDDVDILEEALDTIYKLFQRKRIEEQDTAKDINNLHQEIEQLKKQIERLQEQQTDLELTTWR